MKNLESLIKKFGEEQAYRKVDHNNSVLREKLMFESINKQNEKFIKEFNEVYNNSNKISRFTYLAIADDFDIVENFPALNIIDLLVSTLMILKIKNSTKIQDKIIVEELNWILENFESVPSL